MKENLKIGDRVLVVREGPSGLSTIITTGKVCELSVDGEHVLVGRWFYADWFLVDGLFVKVKKLSVPI